MNSDSEAQPLLHTFENKILRSKGLHEPYEESSASGQDHDELKPILESTYNILSEQGCQWHDVSKLWTIWTIWKTNLTDSYLLNELIKINHKDHSMRLNMEDFFEQIINEFSSFNFDVTEIELQHGSVSMSRFMILKLDLNTEAFCSANCTAEFQAFEIVILDGTATRRYDTISVFVGSELAEILRAICRRNEIVIIIGGYRIVYMPNRRILLLNGCENIGPITIVRLPGINDSLRSIASVNMVENISPTETANCFQFRYFIKHGETRSKYVTKFGNFRWGFTPRIFSKFMDFPMPIQFDMDLKQAYQRILDYDMGIHTTSDTPTKISKVISKIDIDDSTYERKLSSQVQQYEKTSSIFTACSTSKYFNATRLNSNWKNDNSSERRKGYFPTRSSNQFDDHEDESERSIFTKIRVNVFSAVYQLLALFLKVVGTVIMVSSIIVLGVLMLSVIFEFFNNVSNSAKCHSLWSSDNDDENVRIQQYEEDLFALRKIYSNRNNSRFSVGFQKIESFAVATIVHIGSFLLWIWNNCGFETLFRHIGLQTTSNGPIV